MGDYEKLFKDYIKGIVIGGIIGGIFGGIVIGAGLVLFILKATGH